MELKQSIFGSKGEKNGFHLTERTWGDRYWLCSQMPLSALFTPDPNWRDTSNLFFKTNVDYVLCTKEGRPLLAIDFDGLGRGFDRYGTYVKVVETDDKYRKLKFDLKLEWARETNFPYYVVASDEFRSVGDGIELTVVDGIIGESLAHREFQERVSAPSFANWLEEHTGPESRTRSVLKEYYGIDGSDLDREVIESALTDLEIDCQFEHQPIIRKQIELRRCLEEMLGESGWSGGEYFFSLHPGHIRFFRETAGRSGAIVGCECTLHATPVGDVSAKARLREVAYSTTIAPEVAELLALNKLYLLLKNRPIRLPGL